MESDFIELLQIELDDVLDRIEDTFSYKEDLLDVIGVIKNLEFEDLLERGYDKQLYEDLIRYETLLNFYMQVLDN
jgi:hypothetical protein